MASYVLCFGGTVDSCTIYSRNKYCYINQNIIQKTSKLHIYSGSLITPLQVFRIMKKFAVSRLIEINPPSRFISTNLFSYASFLTNICISTRLPIFHSNKKIFLIKLQKGSPIPNIDSHFASHHAKLNANQKINNRGQDKGLFYCRNQ